MLGKEDAARLNELGAQGRRAAELAASTAPAGRPAGRAGGSGSAGPGSSGLGQVVGQTTGFSDSGGMGPLLPLLIVGTVLGAIAYIVRRRSAHD